MITENWKEYAQSVGFHGFTHHITRDGNTRAKESIARQPNRPGHDRPPSVQECAPYPGPVGLSVLRLLLPRIPLAQHASSRRNGVRATQEGPDGVAQSDQRLVAPAAEDAGDDDSRGGFDEHTDRDGQQKRDGHPNMAESLDRFC